MYSTLKKCESEEGSSIIKVFPGVEFLEENGGTVVHVIAVFEDEDDEKIRAIPSYLTDDKGNVVSGDLVLKEHEAARWLTKDTLHSVEWLPADLGLIEKIETLEL